MKGLVHTTQAQKMVDLTFGLHERCQGKLGKMASGLNLTVAEFKVIRCFTGTPSSQRVNSPGA
jgi:hypothetical protein